MVIVSRTTSKFIKNPKALTEKNLGIITLENPQPEQLKYMKNSKIYFSTDKALDDLMSGKVEYLVGDFKRISLAISNRYMGDSVKIAGFTNAQSYFSYGTNDPLLADLIEKIMPNYISENEILSNELVTSRIIDINHKYIFTITTISLFVLIVLLFLLKKAIKEKNRANKITKALVNSFETANQYNDEDTGMHITRVNKYSEFMARKLKCSKKFIEEIGEYASLHDVGKIGIPDIILKKPGKLTDEEFETMKEHTKIGFHLIKKMYIGKVAENIALYHHEKYNGKGYPFGLYGNEIPLEARIVSLADAYDAV
ncbi:MAG: HD domain-containing protein [Cetobacterium sp.]|nr:HD domain-containing protein [Cetobacterium sp.]